jgi:beta-alanine--pyruvate transaminase
MRRSRADSRNGARISHNAPGARGTECANRSYDDGILIRAAADTLMISPPLIITEEQIEAIFSAIRRALHAID